MPPVPPRQPIAPPGHGLRAGDRPNSVNLDGARLAALLDQLDGADGRGGAKEREFTRWPFRHVSIRVEVIHPGGNAASISVACRNLSRGGMSVLHNAYLHSGSRCTIHLPSLRRGTVPVAGRIARCAHSRGVVHEVAIRFDEPVTVRDFARAGPAAHCFSLERVDPASVRGRVVYADAGEADRRIASHHVLGTEVHLRPCATAQEAVDLAGQGCDLVVADCTLADGTGTGLPGRLRSLGIRAPVILVSSDTGALTRAEAAGVPANAFLAKPLTRAVLLRALAEYLTLGPQTATLRCTLDPADPEWTLVDAYVTDLRSYAGRLGTAFQLGRTDACRVLCLQLKGSAPVVGFGAIAQLADEAAAALARIGPITGAAYQIRTLITACERARAA